MPLDFNASIAQHQQTMQALAGLEQAADNAAGLLAECFRNGRMVFVCGNGGSASDAQHFAAELTGRFEKDRPGFPAVALTTDSSALTAISNDYGFEAIFARQLESLGRAGDLLVVISTSGNSPNMLRAVEQARSQQIKVIGLLGRDGGAVKEAVDVALVVPGERTSRIQEAHIFLLHYLCEAFEP